MNNITPTNDRAVALAAIIAQALNKGTVFAGFDYPDSRTGAPKRRNVTVGSRLSKFTVGGEAWGKSFARGSLVSHNGKTYLQGVENNTDEPHIKRFSLDKVSNFVIG